MAEPEISFSFHNPTGCWEIPPSNQAKAPEGNERKPSSECSGRYTVGSTQGDFYLDTTGQIRFQQTPPSNIETLRKALSARLSAIKAVKPGSSALPSPGNAGRPSPTAKEIRFASAVADSLNDLEGREKLGKVFEAFFACTDIEAKAVLRLLEAAENKFPKTKEFEDYRQQIRALKDLLSRYDARLEEFATHLIDLSSRLNIDPRQIVPQAIQLAKRSILNSIGSKPFSDQQLPEDLARFNVQVSQLSQGKIDYSDLLLKAIDLPIPQLSCEARQLFQKAATSISDAVKESRETKFAEKMGLMALGIPLLQRLRNEEWVSRMLAPGLDEAKVQPPPTKQNGAPCPGVDPGRLRNIIRSRAAKIPDPLEKLAYLFAHYSMSQNPQGPLYPFTPILWSPCSEKTLKSLSEDLEAQIAEVREQAFKIAAEPDPNPPATAQEIPRKALVGLKEAKGDEGFFEALPLQPSDLRAIASKGGMEAWRGWIQVPAGKDPLKDSIVRAVEESLAGALFVNKIRSSLVLDPLHLEGAAKQVEERLRALSVPPEQKTQLRAYAYTTLIAYVRMLLQNQGLFLEENIFGCPAEYKVPFLLTDVDRKIIEKKMIKDWQAQIQGDSPVNKKLIAGLVGGGAAAALLGLGLGLGLGLRRGQEGELPLPRDGSQGSPLIVNNPLVQSPPTGLSIIPQQEGLLLYWTQPLR